MYFSDNLYTITVTGLKPSTKHNFYFETINRDVDCRPIGGDLGDDLITSNNGQLTFEFHYTNSTEDAWIIAVGGLQNWNKLHSLGDGLYVNTNLMSGWKNKYKLLEVKALNSYAMCRITATLNQINWSDQTHIDPQWQNGN